MSQAVHLGVRPIGSEADLPDECIVRRVNGGDVALFEILMRRYNQRLFRIVRSVLRNDADAEDVLQEAYLRAFQHLSEFAGRSLFSTWLTKIALYEALGVRRRRSRVPMVSCSDEDEQRVVSRIASQELNPEHGASNGELARLLEDAIDELPWKYRSVFLLRQVDGLDTEEAAAALDLSLEAIKTRLHRARHLLQKRLGPSLDSGSRLVFPFLGERCDRIVLKVMHKLRHEAGPA